MSLVHFITNSPPTFLTNPICLPHQIEFHGLRLTLLSKFLPPMKFTIRTALLSAIALFSSIHLVKAQHIRGAEIAWDQLGKDTFKVMVHVYQDCKDTLFYDNPISFAPYNYVKTIGKQTISKPTDVTPGCGLGCNTCTDTGCTYQHGIHKYTISQTIEVGPARKAGFKILSAYWSDGTRYSSSGLPRSGTFSVEAGIDITLSRPNSSPKFQNQPPLIGYFGRQQEFNQSVVDVDVNKAGKKTDSIVYSIDCVPVSRWLPKSRTYSNCHCCFGFIYNGYSGWGNPLPSGYVGVYLDSTTGRLNFRPTSLNKDYLRIKVEEYRNGKKISELVRDVMFEPVRGYQNSIPAITINAKASFNFEQPDTLRICTGDTFYLNMRTNDMDTMDSTSIILENGLPDSRVFKQKVGKYDSMSIAFLPKNEHVSGSPYKVSLKVTDDHCPLPAIRLQEYLIYVDSSDFKVGKSITELKSDCGKYKFKANLYGNRPLDSIKWYLNDTQLLSKKAAFSHRLSTLGKQAIKTVVYSRNCQRILYDTIDIRYNKHLRIDGVADTSLCLYKIFKPQLAVRDGYGQKNYAWSVSPSPLKLVGAKTPNPEMEFRNQPKGILYKLNYEVTDSLGCSVSGSFKVFAKYGFALKMMKDTSACYHDSLQLKLPVNPNTPGAWSGPGVTNNKFDGRQVSAGSHNLSYYEEGFNFCIVDLANITIKASPSIALGSDFTICENVNSVSLTAQPSGGKWTGSGLQNNLLFIPGKAGVGTHSLTYQVTANNGCAPSKTIKAHVKANNLTVNAGPDIEVCAQGQRLPVAVAPFGGIWSSNPVSPIERNGAYFLDANQADTGNYELTYYFKDSLGCEDTDTLNILFKPIPEVIIGTDSSLCFSRDTFFPLKAQPVGGRWLDQKVVGTQGNYRFPVTAKHLNQTLKLPYTYANAVGCSDTSVLKLQVKKTPKVQVPGLDTFCYLNQKQYPLNGKPIGGSWTGNNVVNSNGIYAFEPSAQSPRTKPHVFWYHYTHANGCSDSAKREVLVKNAVVADFEIAKASWFTNRYEIEFKNTSSANADNFLWYYGNGDLSRRKNPSYVFTKPGAYSISLLSSNRFCADSITKPNLIDFSVGLGGPKRTDFGVIYIQAERLLYFQTAGEIEQVWLTDITGRNILPSNNWERGEQTLQLPFGMNSGMYMVSVRLQNGQWQKGKVLIP